MLLNAAITTTEAKLLWGIPGWLPEEIGIIIDEQGQFFCYEGDEINMHIQRGIHKIKVYSLMGLVADVDSGQHQKSHLVSLVNGKNAPIFTLAALTSISCPLSANEAGCEQLASL